MRKALRQWYLGFSHRLISHFLTPNRPQEDYCCNLLTILAFSAGTSTTLSNLPESNWQAIMSPTHLRDRVHNTVKESSFMAHKKNLQLALVLRKTPITPIHRKAQCLMCMRRIDLTLMACCFVSAHSKKLSNYSIILMTLASRDKATYMHLKNIRSGQERPQCRTNMMYIVT